MMDKKVIFALVAAFCALQCATHAYAGVVPAPKNAIDDAVAHAKELIAEWTAALEAWLDAEVEALQTAVNQLIAEAQALLAQAEARLDALVAEIKDAIAKAEDEAAELGADISECTEGEADAAEALVANAVARAKECVNGIVSEAEALLVSTVALGAEALQLGNDTLAEVNACLDGPTILVVHCINKELDRFQVEGEKLVTELQADIAEAHALLANLSADVNGCVLPLVAETEEDVNALAAEVAECIDGKLHATTAEAGL